MIVRYNTGTKVMGLAISMRFKRFLAIILLLILPLQSTLAAIDSCCNDVAAGTSVYGDSAKKAPAAESGDECSCCAACDFCHHAGWSGSVAHANLSPPLLPTGAPIAHPELPIDSFIPDVPPRPDRA